MGLFERYLSVWVGLAIVFGMFLGNLSPELIQAVAGIEYAHVNFAVAAPIWIMIYPMMVQINFASNKAVRNKPQGFLLTLVVNWLKCR